MGRLDIMINTVGHKHKLSSFHVCSGSYQRQPGKVEMVMEENDPFHKGSFHHSLTEQLALIMVEIYNFSFKHFSGNSASHIYCYRSFLC